MTPIADDFARNFTQYFYDYLIKGTVTPRKAFEIAKNSVTGKDKDKFCCCCTHAHETSCKYLKYLREKKIPKDCYLHTPKCSCSRRYEGYHKTDCRFLLKFKTDLDLPMIPVDYDPNSNWELLCCCKLKQPHNENQKIMIVKRPPFIRMTEEQINAYPEAEREKVRRKEDKREEVENLLNIRDEQFLDLPFFENLKDKKHGGGGVFIRDNQMQEITRMPDVLDDL